MKLRSVLLQAAFLGIAGLGNVSHAQREVQDITALAQKLEKQSGPAFVVA